MKKHIALLLAVVLLLSACSTAQPDSTSADETKSTTETMNGTTDTTEGTTTTEGSGETGSTETKQETETTDGTGAATAPSTGNSDPTQGNTKPTTGSTEPTSNTTPSTGSNDPTAGSTTTPTTGTTPTEPTTQPTTPAQPTTPTTPTTPTQPTMTLTINTKNKTTVFVGETLQIDYSYSGNTSELTWSSTDTSVLTVNGGGLVTAKAAGAATVKVTDGATIKRVSINVSDAPKTTSIEMNGFNAPLYDGVVKYAGDYMSFKVNVQPDASNPNITVTSSNTSVVSVSWNLNYADINEVTLNFKSAGTTTVTITSADGAKSKSYSITVKDDYACNPGSGQLTPEQFVNCYNGIVSANGMSTSGMPTGYLVWTVSPNELTWSKVRREAEGLFHHWWSIGYRTLVLTYEGTDENGNHVFYERGY